jgi:uncharacterized protein
VFNRLPIRLLIAVTAACLLLFPITAPPAFAAEAQESAYRTAARKLVAEQYLKPLAEQTAALEESASRYCAGHLDLAAMRASYNAAIDAYMRIQWLNFGPVVLFDNTYRLNFWPDGRNAITRQLAALRSNPATFTTADFDLAKQSVAVQGLPALERLLFEEPLASAGTPDCQLIQGIAANVMKISAGYVQNWQRLDEMPSADAKEFDQSMFSALQEHLEAIADRKLARVLGPTPDQSQFRAAEAWRSQRSLRNVRINLEAVRQLLLESGDRTWTEALAHTEVPPLFEEAEDILKAYEAMPMEQAVQDAAARVPLERLVMILREIRAAMVKQLAPAIGVTVGFNSMDGD